MPYVEEILTVGRADNGYVLTVRVPYKEEEDTMKDSPAPVYPGTREKVIVCKDTEELVEKIGTIIPALTDKLSAEDQFDNAFKEIEND